MSFERLVEWSALESPLALVCALDGARFAMATADEVVACRGALANETMPAPISAEGFARAKARCASKVSMEMTHRALAKMAGFAFGASFRLLSDVCKGDAEIAATIQPPPDALRRAHPTVIDACFQAVFLLLGFHAEPSLPTRLASLTVPRSLPATAALFVHAVTRRVSPYWICADFDLYDSSGAVLASCRGFELSALKSKMPPSVGVVCKAYVPFRLAHFTPTPLHAAHLHDQFVSLMLAIPQHPLRLLVPQALKTKLSAIEVLHSIYLNK